MTDSTDMPANRAAAHCASCGKPESDLVDFGYGPVCSECTDAEKALVASGVGHEVNDTTEYLVIGDAYSDHQLPIGATVTEVPAPDWAADSDTGPWYSMGGDGDEVAIDPRDLRPATEVAGG